MKIVIAEPDMGRQRQLRTILTSLGNRSADLESYPDARSVLAAIRKKRFEVAFFGHHPGVFDAVALIQEIRNGNIKSLPIVLYSSSLDRDTLMEANEQGANGFLAYPFSVSDVEEAIITAKKRNP